MAVNMTVKEKNKSKEVVKKMILKESQQAFPVLTNSYKAVL
jgi:hypothetical protein